MYILYAYYNTICAAKGNKNNALENGGDKVTKVGLS